MTTLTLFDPDSIPPPPVRIGRVWNDYIEYVWWDNGWTSDKDPEGAKLMTMSKIGDSVTAYLPDAYDETLIKVAGWYNAKWEVLLKQDNVPGRIY